MPRALPASRKRANAQTHSAIASELLNALVLEIEVRKGAALSDAERDNLHGGIEAARRFYFLIKLRRQETVQQRAAAARRLSRLMKQTSSALMDLTPLTISDVFGVSIETTSVFTGQLSGFERMLDALGNQLRKLSEQTGSAATRLREPDRDETDEEKRVQLSPLGTLLMVGSILFHKHTGVRPTAYVDRAHDTYVGNFLRFAGLLAISVGEQGRDALGKTAAEAIHEALAPRQSTS